MCVILYICITYHFTLSILVDVLLPTLGAGDNQKKQILSLSNVEATKVTKTI